MLSWVLDQIPLWVYIVVVVGVTGALFYFFSPILVPLWNITPRPVKYVLGGLLALGSVFVLGRNKGASDAKAIEKQREANAVKQREKIDEDVAKRSDPDLNKSASKWMRD